MESKTPVIGVYDDHDYGANDSNGMFMHKDIGKKHYLDFVKEPVDSERRTGGRGIYTSYSFGDQSGFKTVRIILLDVRYNKTGYFFENNPDMLGMIKLFII